MRVPLKYDCVRSPSPLVKLTDAYFSYPWMTLQDAYCLARPFLCPFLRDTTHAFITVLKFVMTPRSHADMLAYAVPKARALYSTTIRFLCDYCNFLLVFSLSTCVYLTI